MDIVTPFASFGFKNRQDAEAFCRKCEEDALDGIIVHGGIEWKLPAKGLKLTFEYGATPHAGYPVKVTVYAHLVHIRS